MKLLEEIAIRESGEVVLTEKIIVGNSFAIERRAIQPGEDYSTEKQRVQSICELVHSESYLGIAVPQSIVPNWEGFNFALFSDADFISYGIAAQSVNPYLVPALTERYGKIAELGLAGSGFSAYWDSFCSSVGVTAIHREGWALLAEANDLPADLVSVIRA